MVMEMPQELTRVLTLDMLYAALAGLLSFLSPCVLPLVPGYLSFVSGLSVDQMREAEDRARVLSVVAWRSLLFVIGFSIVFVAMGAGASAIGEVLKQHRTILGRVGGAILILFGLHMAGILRWSALYREKRFHLKKLPLGAVGAVLMGLAFGFGWTPCIGPFLASILALAATQEGIARGMLLLGAYSLGLGAPFIAAALALQAFLSLTARARRWLRAIEIAGGILLVAVGVLIATNSLALISQRLKFLNRFSL
jgi:cytochrome c-type biogenesis protein